MGGSTAWRAFLAGIAAVVLGAGIGELAAAAFAPASSPLAAIGDVLIDLAPPWAKEWAIGLFGTSDKLALLIAIALVLLAVAGALGLLEARFARIGVLLCAALGIVGIAAASSRADATGLAWAPSAVAGAAAAFTIGPLVRRAGAAPGEPAAQDGAAGMDRRRFFAWAGAATVIGVAAAVGGSLLQTGARTVTAARRALHLPVPARAAAPIPPGAELRVPGLAPLVTPNERFYRIDTALLVPQVDPAQWSLRIHGMVDHEVTLTWAQLLALPLQESYTTLACVSNEVGGELIGNAKWLGYPIRHLLAQAGPHADADMVLSRSADGFTAGTPLEVLTDQRDAVLAVGMNDEPLPLEHGFPVRMVVPGLYGYVSATKWVVDLEVTRFDRATGYWTTQGWAPRGPIKLESRIDVPGAVDTVAAGPTVIAGVAWQQHVGVSRVEVSIDDGAWQTAELASAISDDTWVQWRLPWTATSGHHVIRCRATSRSGQVQTARQAPPAPDGATGWPQVTVQVP
ncbi:oxidoreductase [Microbacterium protaetiae]|uniref:Oxidoreductase n=1 Tax=Microbacterium protaetiae TaxID=2509458 RepID=A0A4P6EG47_9MICO|nr:molybdopterin-dependent oxidoreductase [Microbacterium protaetiae]QAY59117.1 oxidoreductase [Microbacterium protaetiae]